MNVLLSAVHSRYLLYLEDDWQTLLATSDFLDDALAILRHHAVPFDDSREGARSRPENETENEDEDEDGASSASSASSERRVGPIEQPIVQVLLNDQSSRACAYALTAACEADPKRGRAGWARTIYAGPGPEGATYAAGGGPGPAADDARSGAAARSRSRSAGQEDNGGNGGEGGEGGATDPSRQARARGIEYNIHEFGSVYGDHTFTYWPGFSLNPGVWDLAQLRASFERAHGLPLRFNTSERRFEQQFSMAVSDAGLRTAHLRAPGMVMRHIGTDVSAYELNNLARPWDILAEQTGRDLYG